MHKSLNRRNVMRLAAATSAVGVVGFNTRAQEAQSTPPSVEAYATPPLVDMIALSPDGRRIALISQKGDNKVLIYLDAATQTPKHIELGVVKARRLMWADNDHVVIQTSETLRDGRYRREVGLVTVINLTTRQKTMLFSKSAGRYYFHPTRATWPYRVRTADGYNLIAMTRSSQNRLVIQKFGMDDPSGVTLYEGSEFLTDYIVSPDGRIVAIVESSPVFKYWRLKFNRAAAGTPPRFEQVHQVNSDNFDDWPEIVTLAPSGDGIILALFSGEDGWYYHEMSAQGVLGPALVSGSGEDMISAISHPATGRLAGFAIHDDWFHYQFNDPLLKTLTVAAGDVMGPAYRFILADFAEDPRRVILYGESPEDAGSYYYCDFSDGTVFTIFSNYLDLDSSAIAEQKAIDYAAADGLKIHAYLTLPRNRTAKNLPLIVLPHGGPQARDYAGFDWQAQALASRGYAVLQPNFRGSTGYGEAFIRAGDGEFGRKMQTDLSDGVRHLAAQGIVDPGRVAIIGTSYGGYAALAGATIDTGVYRCAVSIAGVSHPEWFLNQYWKGSYAEKLIRRRLGDPKRYDEVSPWRRAGDAYCPIMLIHGSDDSVVPIDQSQRMEKALKAAGKPVEFVTYKGQDHWESIGSYRIDMMNRVVTFLAKHNPA